MKRKAGSLALVVVLVVCAVQAATTRYVAHGGSSTPPYDTWNDAAEDVQTVVDAADNGDTIVISNGQYLGAIDLNGRVLSFAGMGVSQTFLAYHDAVNHVPVFYIHDTSSVSIADLSIVKSNVISTGGITCNDSTVTVTRCLIGECSAFTYNSSLGGGMCISNSQFTVDKCVVYYSFALNGGGGLAIIDSGGLVNNCRIVNNWMFPSKVTETYGGGAIYVDRSDVMIRHCIAFNALATKLSMVLQNIMATNGIYVTNCSPDVVNSVLVSNRVHTNAVVRYCCGPDVPAGSGNVITNDPLLTVSYHLQWDSPCVSKALDVYVYKDYDIDNELRVAKKRNYPPGFDIGCDVWYSTTRDRVPDWWKAMWGFNIGASNVWSQDQNRDGVSNIDHYVNETLPINTNMFRILGVTNMQVRALRTVTNVVELLHTTNEVAGLWCVTDAAPGSAFVTNSVNGVLTGYFGFFSWTPATNQVGQWTNIEFYAFDTENGVTNSCYINVLQTNRAPSMGPLPSQVFGEGFTSTFIVGASDEDDDPLKFSSVCTNGTMAGSRMIAMGPLTGKFFWIPPYNAAGQDSNTYIALVSAADDEYSAGQYVAITVTNVTAPPGNVEVIINNGYRFTNSTEVSLTLIALYADLMSIGNDPETALSNWVNYAESTNWTVLGYNRTNVVYARFKAFWGDETTNVSSWIVVETNLPTATPLFPPDGYLVVSNEAMLSWTGVDDMSGIAWYQVQTNGGVFDMTTDSFFFAWTDPGSNSWRVRAYDRAGNEGPWSATRWILPAPPSDPSLVINDGARSTNAAAVTLSLSAGNVTEMTVAGSVAALDTNWMVFQGTLPWLLPRLSGTNTVYARFRSHNGGETTNVSSWIIVDTNPPTCAQVYPPDQAIVATGLVVVTWTGADGANGSGVARYKIETNGAPVDLMTNLFAYALTEPVSNSWRVRAYDLAGNEGPWTPTRWFYLPYIGAPPENVVATKGTYTNKVFVSWDPVAEASLYRVYRNTIDDPFSSIVVAPSLPTNGFEDTTVTKNLTYFYWVKSGSPYGMSGFSLSDIGYAGTVTPIPNVAPTFVDFSTDKDILFSFCGNEGGGLFAFSATVTSGGTWLDVTPASGTVVVSSVGLQLTANRGVLTFGVHTGLVAVAPSVGSAFTVTARIEVTAASLAFAMPNGPYQVDQGQPVTFAAAGSRGAMLSYQWDVGAGFSSGASNEFIRFAYTNTCDVATNTVLLVVRDTNAPPNASTNSTTLTVANLPPMVDLGGPYQAATGTAVAVTAMVTDPGASDSVECRFDFDGDSIWDTPWTNVFVQPHAYSASGGYVAICQARDQHGAVASAIAPVLIGMGNTAPVAVAVLAGTTSTETNLPGFGKAVTLDGSGSIDPDSWPRPALYFDWREDAANPQRPVLSDSHTALPTTLPLDKPGVYSFHLVVYDGQYASAPATVVVRVPGWSGSAICRELAGNLPLPGAEVLVTNTASAAEKTCQTDDNGAFSVDAGQGAQDARVARNATTTPVGIVVGPDGRTDENLCFTPTYFVYAGQVVTGSPGEYVGLSNAAIELVIGSGLGTSCDPAGNFGFGSVPETWPPAAAEYPVRIQKAGLKSVVRLFSLSANRNSEIISLDRAQGAAMVSGTVSSQISGLPVEDVVIDFGNGWKATSGTNGLFGPVTIPDGDYAVTLAKQGFTRTVTYLSGLEQGATNVAFLIAGGGKTVFGQILDKSGQSVSNAVVELLSTGGKGPEKNGGTVAASEAGAYDLTVARGLRTIRVTSPDFDPLDVSLDVPANTRRDIILVPEPAAMALLALMLVAVMPRTRR